MAAIRLRCRSRSRSVDLRFTDADFGPEDRAHDSYLDRHPGPCMADAEDGEQPWDAGSPFFAGPPESDAAEIAMFDELPITRSSAA